MRHWRFLSILIIFGLLLPSVSSHAQDGLPPLVVFIEDEQLQTASITDPGPDGLTRLAQIFQDLGARTAWVRLSEPIPADAKIVVLVRPVRTLPVDYLARLWTHLLRGNHLLLAIDPSGPETPRPDSPVAINTERSNGGLATLLLRYYGVSLNDTFIAESWFANETIVNQRTAYSRVFAETWTPLWITQPLLGNQLPVEIWGARSLDVEPFGLNSYAFPLLYTESAYGETNRDVFKSTEPARLEINIGSDEIGKLLVGALAVNSYSGSRLVVLGDSEIVQNDFGLALYPNTQQPIHWGDWLLTERIAAWLLDETATGSQPGLPDSFTHLAIDGDGSDWEDRPALKVDGDEGGSPPGKYDITQVQTFYDDSYLYVYAETASRPPSDVRVSLGIENTWDGVADILLLCHDQQVLQEQAETFIPVSGASCAVSSGIEVRLPIRVTGVGGLVDQLCVASATGATADALDCIEQPLGPIPQDTTAAPVRTAGVNGPLVSVFSSDNVNLREGPGPNFPAIAFLPNGTLLEPIGRTAAGDWIEVQNALYSGWIATFLVRANFVLSDLPVAEALSGEPATEETEVLESVNETGEQTPSGNTYVVQPGDTLYAIAQEYGTTVEALAEANNLANQRLIAVGQVLNIP